MLTACGAGGAGPKPADQLDFGVSMARRGLWNEALFRFQQAQEERPGDARILNNIAVAYEAVGLFDEALETYQEALRSYNALDFDDLLLLPVRLFEGSDPVLAANPHLLYQYFAICGIQGNNDREAL